MWIANVLMGDSDNMIYKDTDQQWVMKQTIAVSKHVFNKKKRKNLHL